MIAERFHFSHFTLIRVRFRVRAEVKMERMPGGVRILSSFHSSLAHRGSTTSSVALPAGSPLLAEGERTVLEELGGSSLLVLGETH